MKIFYRSLPLSAVILLHAPMLYAQSMGIEFDTELQFTPEGYANYMNLLSLNADYAINDHVTLSAATLSIARTREESLLGDLQAFSNLEADNVPLALSLANVEWKINGHHTLYAGIRTVNEDYFISPVTSFFINSSCGIFPTLSCNYPIANYPVSSVGIHYHYTQELWHLQASVYNGQGYDRFMGRDNIWRITPHSDGVFVMTEGSFQSDHLAGYVGGCYHSGIEGRQEAGSTLWTYAEWKMGSRVSLIADYSHAFGEDSECTDFAGLGAIASCRKYTFGLFADYARFSETSETAIELSAQYPLNDHCSLQAAFHVVDNTCCKTAGLIRLSIQL